MGLRELSRARLERATYGLKDQRLHDDENAITPDSNTVSANPSEHQKTRLARALHTETENDTRLARLCAIWPSLPESTMEAIMRLADSQGG